ncbi:hypothetical protein DAI22_06g214603 [Oryza sativa Japonica Group]|nr:hypothetical protein DAI22_06g214603 [Oryza sativa Japonica Group]
MTIAIAFLSYRGLCLQGKLKSILGEADRAELLHRLSHLYTRLL